MNSLPPFVQEKLQPRLKVIWWGHRAVFEVVEEVSEGVFRSYIIFGIAWNVHRLAHMDGFLYWFSVLILLLLGCQKAILEVMMWQNEIYIVARDEVNGGGRIYKFFGWLSKRYIDEAITIQSPTILPEQPWYWRLWGYVTGEQMMKVKLASVNHTYMEGKKISPEFERAIKFIRGYKAPKEDVPVHDLTRLADLKQAMVDGLIDRDTARSAAQILIGRVIYGD